jgi:rod shape-determining protein MreD
MTETEFSKVKIFGSLLRNIPLLLLLISVLNEFDFNYLEVTSFSFNFPYILIFYWSLKKTESLGYGLIFIAGLINDVVVGFPIGISSLTYLLICGFAAYLRNITLRPNLFKDWIFFLLTILVVNSFTYSLLTLFFLFKINYMSLLINLTFTFLLYFVFAYIFQFYQRKVFEGSNA